MPEINIKKTYYLECTSKDMVTLIASVGQMVTHLKERQDTHGDVSIEEIEYTKLFAKQLRNAFSK